MQTDIDQIVADTPVPDVPLTLYHELDSSFFSADSTTFIGELYGLLGLRNIADQAEGNSGGYPQLNAEFIVSANPDLIFLADTICCGETRRDGRRPTGLGRHRRRAERQRHPDERRHRLALGPACRRLSRGGLRSRAAGSCSGMTDRPRDAGWFAGAGLLLAVAVLVGASIGPAGPPWWRVPLALIDHLPLISVDSGVSQADWNVLWKIRMPRVVLGGLVGGMLSIAGASYQGVFRNPLVDPYLLGVAAGAGLGATIALTMGRGVTVGWAVDPVPLAAFAMAIATVGVTYAVGSSAGGSRSGTTLVLAGIAVVSFATALQTFILQRHNEVIREVFQWVLGRLSGATWSDVLLIAPYVVISSIVLILHRRQLDVFRIGDVEAATLGMSVARSRLVIVVTATLGTAAVVSVSGLIGFVGLVIPARHPPRRRRLVPSAVAAVADVRGDVPDPRRRAGPHADRSGRDADRRGHRIHRRPVLHLPPAHEEGGVVSSIEFAGVSVRYGKQARCSNRSPTGSGRGSGSA